MYRNLKNGLMYVSLLFVAILAFLFLKSYESELLGGYSQMFYVEKADASFLKELDAFAKERDLALAHRIVDSDQGQSNQLVNTYVLVGQGSLPKQLKEQRNQKKIANTGSTGLYILLNQNSRIDQVLPQLKKAFPNIEVSNASRADNGAFLRYALSIKQVLLVFLLILLGFISLIFVEYVDGLKAMGIRRLEGESKFHITCQNFFRDSRQQFIFLNCLLIGSLLLLYLQGTFSSYVFFLICCPLILVYLIFFLIHFLFSHFFYHLLQKQSLKTSLQGKAPVGMVFVLVLCLQLLTLSAMCASLADAIQVEQDVRQLEDGLKSWNQKEDYYTFLRIDGGDLHSQSLPKFFKEVSELEGILAYTANMDQLVLSQSKEKNSYLPTADGVSNVIYVNKNFISQTGIQVKRETQEKISSLEGNQEYILFPSSIGGSKEELSKKWIHYERYGFFSASAEGEKKAFRDPPQVDTYQIDKPFFLYPVFTLTQHIISNQSFMEAPIVIVRAGLVSDFQTILFKDRKKVQDIIEAYQLTGHFSGMVHAQTSMKNRLMETRRRQTGVLLGLILSFITSGFLVFIMNKIYFYHYRRQQFIERMAGESFWRMHALYLILILGLLLGVECLLLLLKAPLLLMLLPLASCLEIAIIFILQAGLEKKANVLFLKGM